jgi:TatD DNase family protein
VPGERSREDAGAGTIPAITDTHVHLNLDSYDGDRDEVIARARDAGIGLMVNVGFNLATSRESVALTESHEQIYASVGLHPHDAAEMTDALLGELRTLAHHPKVVAIGETGLDYYRDLSPRDAQEAAFRSQIRLAKELELPLIVHNREALEDVLRILDDEGAPVGGGVMHCFPGDAEYAREVVARGFYVGVGGPVTYSKRERLTGVVESVPLNRLLIETDAPWLPPVPHRGKRNEPAYVALVASAVADIRGMALQDLARATTGNALRLFRAAERPPPSIAYEMWGNLYLNVTNRCTNECSFCIRYQTDVLWGHNLRLQREPTVGEILDAIGDPTRYREIVFCGYGEPTIRLDAVKAVGAEVRRRGGRVRIDTNGQGSLIWNRNIAPELAEVADAVSVSLNAHDTESYDRLCRPTKGAGVFEHVLSFIRECLRAGLDVAASVVDVPGVDLARTEALARELGVPLRVRGGSSARRAARGGR